MFQLYGITEGRNVIELLITYIDFKTTDCVSIMDSWEDRANELICRFSRSLKDAACLTVFDKDNLLEILEIKAIETEPFFCLK